MSHELMPEGESLRRAVRWISDETNLNPNAKRFSLIQEASNRFDLSPKDEAFLIRHFIENKGS